MRYRALTATGDYSFGRSGLNFLVNSPAAVAQAVKTRLALFRGEWFLDTTDGTPWASEVLGTGTTPTYDQAIRRRVLGTQGVMRIASYSSAKTGRTLSVSMTLDTVYGAATVEATL